MKLSGWMKALGLLVFVFMLGPVAIIVWISFFDQAYLSFPAEGYSLRWYAGLVDQTELFRGLLYSAEIAVITTIISLFLGVSAAIALSRSRLRGRTLFENVFLLPLVIPAIITGMALYIYLYQLSGIVQGGLVPSTWSLIAAHVIITLPWTFRLTYAGAVSIGTDVERASLDLGRGSLATLMRVTLPLLRPSLIGSGIFAFIFSFGDLEISLFLVSPGQTTLPVAMVQYAEFNVDPTLAAVATVQIVLIGLLLLIANKFIRFGEAFSGGLKQ
ncbi:ABC transporter permease [Microbacterium sp. MPKO10]|uniref:ABC transporter permease n=1 Tax=Microbacterium sp. MPKO10 TaxID=2989818 RepID=UPI0022366A85|nr:ABC transporter permease [Microbacterium sp. MPKO10]MCW4456841.1 ABC transporter permease [Microbacterium sp. MPKO10]